MRKISRRHQENKKKTKNIVFANKEEATKIALEIRFIETPKLIMLKNKFSISQLINRKVKRMLNFLKTYFYEFN